MNRADSIALNEALTEATGVKHYNSVQEMFEEKLSETDPEFAYATVKDLHERLNDRDKLLIKAAKLLRRVSEESETYDSEIGDFVGLLTGLGYC